LFNGIDVSNNNGAVAFSEAKREGVSFVYAKATEGTGFVDPDYDANRKAVAHQGMKFGAFHFARPGQGSGTEQAQKFLAIAKVQVGDLIPTLDFEVDDGIGSTKVLAKFVRDFCEQVKLELGVYPILYTYPSFRPDVLGYLAYTKLWLAKPASWLRIPGHWKAWVMWQNASRTLAVAGKGIDFDQATKLSAITYYGRIANHPIVTVSGPKGGEIVKEKSSKVSLALAKLILRFHKVTVSK
jgi:GH25 family lysozyme M1 (1,4-beta-N-acetylmuramidase)